MRIVEEDPRLGVTKVVWRFSSESDPTPAFSDEDESENVEAGFPDEVSGGFADEHPVADGSELAETEPSQSVQNHVPEDVSAVSETTAQVSGHVEDLRAHIEFLQRTVEDQARQLRSKDELIRNFQVLLKTEQEQVLRLETARLAEGGWVQRIKRFFIPDGKS